MINIKEVVIIDDTGEVYDLVCKLFKKRKGRVWLYALSFR